VHWLITLLLLAHTFNFMKVYFAADHAGFALKEQLITFVRELAVPGTDQGYNLEDFGAYEFDADDDYPDYVQLAAAAVARESGARAIIFGASGQGEAIVANRVAGVRAVVYYGEPSVQQTDADGEDLGMIASTRTHNDSNVLSLAARFLTLKEAQMAVQLWLETGFEGGERHVRRIAKIDLVKSGQ